MRRIILTSTGLSNTKIRKAFLKLIDKIDKKSVVIITTAAREKEKNKYSQLAKRQFKEMGFNKVDFLDLEYKNPKRLENYDIIYVCGGNSFYLLKHIKESGADKIIKKLIKQGVVYIGVSAGSILITPTIELSSDKNLVGLKDLRGLGIVNFAIFPHYQPTKEYQAKIRQFKTKHNIPVESLTNTQALLILNYRLKKIGE